MVGQTLKLYGFDKQFIVIRQEESVILYSSYSNKVLKLNWKAYELFELILKSAEQFYGEIDDVFRFYQPEDVVEFVHVLSENGMLFLNQKDILTNGTIDIPEEIIHYADAIEISLDSYAPNLNEKLRRGSKKYEIIKKLENIPDRLKSKIIIKMVVSDHNFDDLLKSRSELQNMGFEHIELTPQQPNTKEEKHLYEKKAVPREKHSFDAKQVALCNGCYEVIAINADGNIYPCQAMIHPDFYLANIFEENWFTSIRNSRITQIFLGMI